MNETANDENGNSVGGRMQALVMPRPYLEGQTVEYNTLLALEAGMKQAAHIVAYLRKHHGEALTVQQVSGALQRLRKERLATYDGRWHRAA